MTYDQYMQQIDDYERLEALEEFAVDELFHNNPQLQELWEELSIVGTIDTNKVYQHIVKMALREYSHD